MANVGPIQSPEQSLRRELIELLAEYERMSSGADNCIKIIKEAIQKLCA